MSPALYRRLDQDDIELEPIEALANIHSHASKHRLEARLNINLLISSLAVVLIVIALMTQAIGWKRLSPTSVQTPSRALHFAEPVSQYQISDNILNDLTLSSAVCNALFPLHRTEIEQTSAWTRAAGGVLLSDVDEVASKMHLRIVLKDGRMYLKSYRGAFHSRALATVQSIYRAVLMAPQAVQDVEFCVGLDDLASPNKAIFALARRNEEPGWLVADFGFYAWPEPGIGAWQTFREQVDRVNEALPWQQKEAQLFWRGALLSAWRKDLVNLSDNHPDWGNARGIDWGDLSREPRVSMADHARYQYLAATEGGDSYSGRLKYLLSSRSVVISHPLRWTQPWHRALNGDDASPDQNIVFVQGPGWAGLEQTMERLLRDPERSHLIARNAYETFHRRCAADISSGKLPPSVFPAIFRLQQWPAGGDRFFKSILAACNLIRSWIHLQKMSRA